MIDQMETIQVNVTGAMGILMVDRACRDDFFTRYPDAG